MSNTNSNGWQDPVAEHLGYVGAHVELHGLLALTETICADTGWPVRDLDTRASRQLDAALKRVRDDAEWSVTV